jgi:hypothetical protein
MSTIADAVRDFVATGPLAHAVPDAAVSDGVVTRVTVAKIHGQGPWRQASEA